MRGYGWCVLRAAPSAAGDSLEPLPFDPAAYEADEQLWSAFRQRMATKDSPFLQWHLTEQLNNDRGVLLFHISRNHTSLEVLDLLTWIGEHGPGSYGLVYVHDDEDDRTYRGPAGLDHSNVFRVLRLRDGVVTELDDPFLGPILPPLDSDADEVTQSWVRASGDSVRGVEVSLLGDGSMVVFVSVAEFLRREPLESEMRSAVGEAIRAVPGVELVYEEDRELWAVTGVPDGEQLLQAVGAAVDDLAPRAQVELDRP